MKYLLTLVLITIAVVACEYRQTPETFVVAKLKESLHDPKSLEIISITPSPLELKHGFLWGMDKFTKMKAKQLANGDPFTVFHIRYRATNAFGAIRKQVIFAVYGFGVVTRDAISDDKSFGRFCYFITSNR